MLCVYALRDPDTDAIRYIGITEHEKSRSREYERGGGHSGSSRVAVWIRDLSHDCKRPKFDVLLRIGDIEIPKHITGWKGLRKWLFRWIVERMFVEHYRREKCDLLNSQHMTTPVGRYVAR